MSSSSALDPRVLESLRLLTVEGEPDVLAEVLALFRDDAPRRLAAIVSAFGRADIRGIQTGAHSLKGASGNIGARRLHEICSAIEAAANQDDLKAVADLIASLEHEAGLVDREIALLVA